MRWLSMVRRNPFVLPMAVVAGLATFFISEGSYWQSQDSIEDVRGSNMARRSLVALERAVADAESGQRGYLLTGRTDYLQPYNEGRSAGLKALATLDAHFSGDETAQADLAELRRLALVKLDELDETIRLVRADQKPAALQQLLSRSGQESMDGLRALVAQLTKVQETLRVSSNQTLDRTLLLSRYGVAVLCAVLLLALVLYLRKSDDLATVQEAQTAALQSAHDRLETEVALRTAQLTELSRYLLKAREDERHRLARNLHDDLGSLLTAAKLDAARIRSRLSNKAPEAQALLADLVEKLNSSIMLGRSIIEDLRPSTLDHLGLAATLELFAADFSQRAGIPVRTLFEPVRLQPGVELVVYRVVQEAMTNVSKYAHARQVWITVASSPDQAESVQVSVRDDGVGFDAHTASRSTFGLLGMRFRVEAEGGSMRVHSAPGQGTKIEVTLPALSPEG